MIFVESKSARAEREDRFKLLAVLAIEHDELLALLTLSDIQANVMISKLLLLQGVCSAADVERCEFMADQADAHARDARSRAAGLRKRLGIE